MNGLKIWLSDTHSTKVYPDVSEDKLLEIKSKIENGDDYVEVLRPYDLKFDHPEDSNFLDNELIPTYKKFRADKNYGVADLLRSYAKVCFNTSLITKKDGSVNKIRLTND